MINSLPTLDENYIEIPKSYTLDNQLITILVQSFLHENILLLTAENIDEKKKELANLLLLKLKLPIFKVELELVNGNFEGRVESTGNNPITFVLKTTAKTF